MGSTAAALMLPPSKPEQFSPACRSFRRRISSKNRSMVPVARLFGPAIFEASKLKVVFLGVDGEKHPGSLPRAYTLTHSDFTSIITLAISNTINCAQFEGWYNRLQRDEVVAEWRKVKGKMSLHVHCHISGGHFLLNLVARLRYYIFSKELPVVLKAFAHGDGNLFENYPELEKAMVWVYFHSNMAEFNKVECWGELRDAAMVGKDHSLVTEEELRTPKSCEVDCECCFPPYSLIPWSHESEKFEQVHGSSEQQLQ
ncbi:protein STAY-GREEN homolog, chloroplastic-like [Dioscorea cayenensis subsp. rotundata]|uniref:Protein STAY-GREEN homolog, chloroplastic-like n=1 Tax=Dioscorea cayennensis subsp. rotundata TaxID=55577 RepID=A0AB40B3B7_DIOCR|nr:protein STAY-GREEN homolog, chloroplastic-like [Dioscorea cayenensis subsp. rotundata]